MKSAIVFASKHGTTAEIAHRIARELGTGHPGDPTPGHAGEATPSPSTPDTDTPADQDVTVLDLADGTPDLAGFDLVVLGTPVYAGRPMSTMRSFLRSGSVPDTARLELFVTGMVPEPEAREKELSEAYPAGVRERAVARGFLGGRFRLSTLNRFERFVVARIAKTHSDVEAIDEEALQRFVSELRA